MRRTAGGSARAPSPHRRERGERARGVSARETDAGEGAYAQSLQKVSGVQMSGVRGATSAACFATHQDKIALAGYASEEFFARVHTPVPVSEAKSHD